MLGKPLFEKITVLFTLKDFRHSQPKAPVIMEYMRFSDIHSQEKSGS